MAKQTIEKALQCTDIVRALNGLVGLPVGGWGETSRARAELRGELPVRDDRDYTWQQLVEHALTEDHTGRYAWRDGVATCWDEG